MDNDKVKNSDSASESTKKEAESNKNSKRNKKAKKAYVPRLSHCALMVCSFFLCLKMHCRIEKSAAFKQQQKKGQMLVIVNHVSAFDFVYLATPFAGKKFNFVVAENMLYSRPVFAKLIKVFHTITKKQFFADFQCIKNIKRYMDAGYTVLICPEGKVAADGATGVIPDTIGRLVQWLGYPVGVITISGGGLVRPKWAHNTRSGRVLTKCDMLYTAEQVKTLSKPELLEGIGRALEHNEHLFQAENKLSYKGSNYAEGLERLLYKCPNCGAEFTNVTSNDTIRCTVCGNEVRYLHTGELVPVGKSVCPERIDLWNAEQKRAAEAEISAENFCLCEPANMFVENQSGSNYRFIASGTLKLDSKKLFFDTDATERPLSVKSKYKVSAMDYTVPVSGEKVPVEEEFKHVSFPINRCDTLANIPGDSLDIYDEKHIYRFMFTANKASTKFVNAVEAINVANCARGKK